MGTRIERQLSFSKLFIQIDRLGADCLVTVQGGERPHIGCTVLAVPRASLKGDGEVSCTSSVLNVTGHKDEQICRYLAEEVCRKSRVTVVCTGGFHFDDISEEQISEVLLALPEIVEKLV